MATKTSATKEVQTSDSAVTAFARHESFHPRFGWLKKGFDKASEDSSVFLRDDSAVILGVGKKHGPRHPLLVLSF